MPYHLFQGNLNRHKIATQSYFLNSFLKIFDTNQGRQTEIYAPELVTCSFPLVLRSSNTNYTDSCLPTEEPNQTQYWLKG